MKTCEENRNNKRTEIERFDWFIERTQTRVAFGWLSKRSGEKTSSPRTFYKSIDTSLWRHAAIRLAIKQYLLHITVFFGGKTNSPFSDLFIHWLIKQITNTYRNHFSRSYENRYINVSWELTAWAPSFNLNSLLYPTRFCFQTTPVFIRLAIASTKLTDGTWAILGFWTLTLRSTRAVWSHITRTIIILAVREWAGTWK